MHYTFRADDQSLPTCFDTPCQITVAVECGASRTSTRRQNGRRRRRRPGRLAVFGTALAGRGSRALRLQHASIPVVSRMRATEHASRGPFYLLERGHGLTEIVVRGAGVL